MATFADYATRIILFGAGASYGSGAVVPRRPPLGDDLFDVLASEFPQSWGALPGPIRKKFAKTFEVGMAALLATRSHAVAPMMQQFAILFSRYQLSSPNAYVSLVESLDRVGKLTGTAFATLNYECLLEWALTSRGRYVECGDVLPGPRGTFLWKLHGSCNFLPRTDQLYVAPPGSGVTYGPGVKFEPGIEVVHPNSVADRLRNTGLYPAMAHYAPGKEVQVSESSIRMIQDVYARAVPGATSVGVIGVRPNVDDDHVWGPLASTSARVLFVGSRDTYSEWRKDHRSDRPTKYLGSRFDAAIDALVEAL